MGVKSFINKVASNLGIDTFESSNKKKSIKELLKKLKKRRLELLKSMKKEKNKESLIQMQEDLDITSLQIRKGKKILNNLKKEKNSK